MESAFMKFFDKPKVIVVATYIDYEIDQLRQCLESEGMVINTEDLMKLIDIYVRSVGLDKDYGAKIKDENFKLPMINTWFSAAVEFNVLNEIEDSDMELYKNILLDYNKRIKEPLNEFLIINNMRVILKEIPTFMQECMTIIRKNFEDDGNIRNIARYTMAATSGEDRTILMSGFFNPNLNTLVMEFISSATSDIANKEVSIIEDSFPKANSDQKAEDKNS